MARSTISSLFGSSPVKPLQTHMDRVQACIMELIPFFNAVFEEDWAEARKQRGKISRLEREADKLKRNLRLNLPKSLFMPISRRDLLEILTMQDKIANKAKDIAGLITGRKMVIPAEITDQFFEFVERSIDASAQAQKAINELDELVETGFRGGEVNLVQSMIKRLDEIEGDTDKLQIRIRTEVAKLEKTLPPIDAMFLYEVIDWVGDLGDRAQQVGSRLELLLAQ